MAIVQIRDVPEDTVRRLKEKADLRGLSLSEFLRRELDRVAATHTLQEYNALVAGLGWELAPGTDAAGVIRHSREERDARPGGGRE